MKKTRSKVRMRYRLYVADMRKRELTPLSERVWLTMQAEASPNLNMRREALKALGRKDK